MELAEAAGATALVEEFFELGRAVNAPVVKAPGGEFEYGEKKERIHLDGFEIDRFPVTNVEYELMVPGHRGMRGEYSSEDRQPAIYVNWYEARLYARWRGCRLPSERKWVKAASWDAKNGEKREYPWGNTFDKTKCNTAEGGLGRTTVVGEYPAGASPHGCQDMAGNVREWMEEEEERWGRVSRGSSWYDLHDYARCAYRHFSNPAGRSGGIGFRCART